MCTLVVRLILHTYTNQKLQVRWNDVMSNQFNMKNGVRQGGVVSPLLFGVYMDGLLDELKYLGIDCYIGQHFCGAAGYVDDIILRCPTSFGLRKIIEVCENMPNYMMRCFMGQNATYWCTTKSTFFKIKGMEVSTCEKTIHLGNVLSTTNQYEMVFDGIKKCNCSVNRFMKLSHQYCCALYGSQPWSLWHDSVNKMCPKWFNALRKV